MNKHKRKIETLLGMKCCEDCGNELKPYKPQSHLLVCIQCANFYDRNLVRYGYHMTKEAKEEVRAMSPDVYEISLMSPWEHIKKKQYEDAFMKIMVGFLRKVFFFV